MTTELWLEKPCEHGWIRSHLACRGRHFHARDFEYAVPDPYESDCWCPGGSRVRLDPDTVVFTIPNDMWGTDDEYTVQDVIDALEEDKLSGDCEADCQEACAYPGQFTECEL